MQTRSMQIAKIAPSSSQIAANIKSLSTTGMIFGIPFPSPIPNHPPALMPNSPCATWYPPPTLSYTAMGSCHTITRCRTWLNRKYATTAARVPPARPASAYRAFFVATYNMTIYATKKTTALPRSFDTTRISTWAAATTVVITTLLKPVSSLNIPATKNTKVIFTSSENWKVTPPISMDSLAPPEIAAMASTTIKRASPTIPYSQVRSFKIFTFLTITGTINESTIPITTISNCLTALPKLSLLKIRNPILKSIHILLTISIFPFL